MRESQFVETEAPYLLSHSVGLLPKNTKDYFDDHYLSPWAQGDESIWPQWLNSIEKFRQALAQLFNTEMLQLCPQANISSGLTKVIAALPSPEKNKNVLLLSEHDFPTVGFVCEQASRLGFETKFIPQHLDHTDVAMWESCMEQDVVAVLLTHVQSNSGVKVPFEDICRSASQKDILSIVDIAQSAGIVPIDLSASYADVVLGSCVKWLCGGPGAGFLWLNSQTLPRLKPIDVGWFSHKQPFEFDIHHFDYADDALRFWGGTPSVAPFVIATNSIHVMLKVGLKSIADHNLQCKRYLREHVAEELFLSPVSEEAQGGTLIVENRNDFAHRLEAAKIKFDSRTTGIRLSPHIYTSTESLSSVVQCLRS